MTCIYTDTRNYELVLNSKCIYELVLNSQSLYELVLNSQCVYEQEKHC